MAKMYVPQKYRSMTSEELEDYVENKALLVFHWEIFLMIDYNNHHKDDDYDGGLSFINRINKQLGWFYQWNVEEIRNSITSHSDYIYMISNMLDEEACSMYGLHYIEKRIM